MFIVKYKIQGSTGWFSSSLIFETQEQATLWATEINYVTREPRCSEFKIECLKNENAQALGKLKKGKKEKPSPHKAEICRCNLEKGREALKLKREQAKPSSAPKTESSE